MCISEGTECFNECGKDEKCLTKCGLSAFNEQSSGIGATMMTLALMIKIVH